MHISDKNCIFAFRKKIKIMKRILFISAFCLLFISFSEAQQYIHKWKMGPLSWNDFVHRTALDGRYSYLEYYMGYTTEQKKVNNVTYTRPAAYAYISAENSWADTHYRTEALLQYNQCAFDLLEVYRRKLTRELNQNEILERDMLLDNTMRRLGEDMTRLERSTEQGANTAELERWKGELKAALDTTAESYQYRFTDNTFRWGMSFDLGILGTGGELHDYFSNAFGLSMNMDLGWKKHFVMTGMYFGGGRCKQNVPNVNSEYNNLSAKDPLTVFDLYAAYGYSIIDNNYIRLTPFVGYGLLAMLFTPDEGSSMGSGNGCFHFGIDFNKKFCNTVDYDIFPVGNTNAMHSMFTLNTKVYATYNNFKTIVGAPQGFTINIQVGLGLMAGGAHID